MPLFRPPNVEKLKAKGNVKGLISALEYKKDWVVRRDAAYALGGIDDTQVIEPLVGALGDRDDVRQAAVEALERIGAPAVEPLIGALENGFSPAREAAAQVLGKIGDTRAAQPLVGALKDRNHPVRKAAAEALGKMGDSRATEPLVAVLKDSNPAVRRAAAETLISIGIPAIEPLIKALGNKYIGRDVAGVLVKIGSAAVEPLIEALQDEDREVRKRAILALGRMRDTRAVEPLIAALDDRMAIGEVAKALEKIGDVRAADPLARRLPDALDSRVMVQVLDKLGYEPQDDEAGAAYYALHGKWDRCVQIGAAAVKPLGRAVSDGRNRSAALEALIRIGEPSVGRLGSILAFSQGAWLCDLVAALEQIGGVHAAESLLAGLKNVQTDVRRASVKALAKIGAPAVEPVGDWLAGNCIDCSGLRDGYQTDTQTPALLINMLGQVGKQRAVKALLKVLHSKNLEIRRTAAKALVRLYASGKVDDEHKQMILACHPLITSKHTDKVLHGCGIDEPHGDRGIGVDFPL
jgi:HEAT repeat protein